MQQELPPPPAFLHPCFQQFACKIVITGNLCADVSLCRSTACHDTRQDSLSKALTRKILRTKHLPTTCAGSLVFKDHCRYRPLSASPGSPTSPGFGLGGVIGRVGWETSCRSPQAFTITSPSENGHSRRRRLTPAPAILLCGISGTEEKNAFRRTKVTTSPARRNGRQRSRSWWRLGRFRSGSSA